jgi:hypothetical protein
MCRSVRLVYQSPASSTTIYTGKHYYQINRYNLILRYYIIKKKKVPIMEKLEGNTPSAKPPYIRICTGLVYIVSP